MKLAKKYIWSVLLIILIFLIWEVSARKAEMPYIFPSPIQIGEKMVELNEILIYGHLPATLQVILIGLFLSILFGVGLAVLMNMSGLAERTFFPLVIASQTIPIIALAPLFVLWFGYGIWSKIVVTVLITFFPITVGVFDGLRSASKDHIDLLRSMGANRLQIFTKIQVPHALPYFFSGLKVAVTLSVIGAAIGEWLGAQAGLGYFSRRMMTQFDGAGVFAPIVWLSILGITLFLIVKLIENITLKWRNYS